MIARFVGMIAIGMLASPVLALEDLSDDHLSEAVGQAGITFVSSPITTTAVDMFWHDTDGSSAFTSAARFNLKNFTQTLSGLSLDFDVASNGNLSTSRTALLLQMSFSDLDMTANPGVEDSTGGNYRSFGTLALTNLALTKGVFLIAPKGDSAAGGTGNSGITLAYANIQQLDGQASFTDAISGSSLSQTFSMTGLDFSGTTIDVTKSAVTDGPGSGQTDGAGLKVKLGSSPSSVNMNISNFAINGTSVGSVNLTGFSLANAELTLRGK